jgi:hypothetical protein
MLRNKLTVSPIRLLKEQKISMDYDFCWLAGWNSLLCGPTCNEYELLEFRWLLVLIEQPDAGELDRA